MDADSELVPRTILLDEFGISDSSERRRRREGADWPPHLLIGRKVLHRRESLSDWLHRRESTTQSVHGVPTAASTPKSSRRSCARRRSLPSRHRR